ncbi:Hypothetical predicted protein [Paramuricea clavata]|uniref:Uncharacterized protein n=1 Tax=Paramuricea clavata TaxID=317549 RepID=A0A7D9I3G1_PARCT|nr:Hypothetical predicted protein [Paramuricea clavata]
MANNETKNVLGRWTKGTITNVKGNIIAMDNTAIQGITWCDRLLIQIYGNGDTNTDNVNNTRQKLPAYLLVNDLTQLKENVQFYFLWGDNTDAHTKVINTWWKIRHLDLYFNLFYKDVEEEEEV